MSYRHNFLVFSFRFFFFFFFSLVCDSEIAVLINIKRYVFVQLSRISFAKCLHMFEEEEVKFS